MLASRFFLHHLSFEYVVHQSAMTRGFENCVTQLKLYTVDKLSSTIFYEPQGAHLQGIEPYMQKTCDVAEKAILAEKNLRKKCVNRDKM